MEVVCGGGRVCESRWKRKLNGLPALRQRHGQSGRADWGRRPGVPETLSASRLEAASAVVSRRKKIERSG